MPYFLIKREKRGLIRSIVVKSLFISNFDPEEAKKLAKAEIIAESIVITALIWLAVKLAYALIIYFWERREQSPSPYYQPGEPGY